MVVEKIAGFFKMDVKTTVSRLNRYRDSNDWKPFHHDAAAFEPDKGIKFIQTRKATKIFSLKAWLSREVWKEAKMK